MAKARSQGISSKNKREVPVRTAKPAKGHRPGFVAQLGSQKGDKITERAKPAATPVLLDAAGQPIAKTSGNQVAVQTVCGPGGSRTIYEKGSCYDTPVLANTGKGGRT